MKYTFQRYKVSCERIFRVTKSSAFWKPENSISAVSWNHRFKVPRKEWKFFLIFEALKWVLHCREIHVAKIPSFVLSNFPHFGSLEMRLLPIREINGSRYLAKRGKILLIFESRKCDFAESWNPRLKGTKHNAKKYSTIFADSWNQRFKVPREECKTFLPFWGLKIRFYLFVKSTFQGYQAACQEIWRMYQDSCEEIFFIWQYENAIAADSLN